MAKNRDTIGQSASFREVPRSIGGLFSVNGNDPAYNYVPAMTDNQREAELIFLDTGDRFGSKSDMNLSSRDHPS